MSKPKSNETEAFGQVLVGRGIISEDQLVQALDKQEELTRKGKKAVLGTILKEHFGVDVGGIITKKPLGKALVEAGVITEETLKNALRKQTELRHDRKKLALGTVLRDHFGVDILLIERHFIKTIEQGVKDLVLVMLEEDKFLKPQEKNLKGKNLRQSLSDRTDVSIDSYTRKMPAMCIKVSLGGERIEVEEDKDPKLEGSFNIIFNGIEKTIAKISFVFDIGKDRISFSKDEVLGTLRPSITKYLRSKKDQE